MQRNRQYLKALWQTGYVPTQADFADLFDSFVNFLDDSPLQIMKNEGVSASYNITFAANSQLQFIDILAKTGTPTVSVGTTLGAQDLVPQSAIATGSSKITVIPKDYQNASTIYVTISGTGTIDLTYGYNANIY